MGNGSAHWDGHQWTAVPVPTTLPLNAVTVTADGQAWATTDRLGGADGGSHILHWDGAAWHLVPSPSNADPQSSLAGIAVEAPGDAWAIGATYSIAPRGGGSSAGQAIHIFGPCGLPTAPVADPQTPGVLYFPEVRHSLRGSFRAYWEQHGGLAQFGYPVTEEFTEKSATDGKTYTVQYFQRNRFELHPENAGTPYLVLLGLLGRTVIPPGADYAPYAPLPAPPPGLRFFAETGHTLAPEFAAYWDQHGGLAVYGYPISEPFQELSRTDDKQYLVQYFERNRLEYHPELPPAFRVSLGLLAVDVLHARGWLP